MMIFNVKKEKGRKKNNKTGLTLIICENEQSKKCEAVYEHEKGVRSRVEV